MKVTIDIPNPPNEQSIINVPIHFCDGQVVDAGGYGFEEPKTREWNRITKRPMDAEEREVWEVEMGEVADEDAYMYENLPEEGEEVLVCTQFGRVFIDTMCKDEGCYFEEYGEMDGIVAWMPLPEPYYGLGQAFDPD